MRLLLSTDPVGGVWDHALTLAGELARRGCAVLVASVGRVPAARSAALPPGIELAERDLRLEWMPGGLDDVPDAAAWLSQLASRWRAEVVHLNQLAPAGARRFAVPVLVAAHSDVLSWFGETRGGKAPAEWEPYARSVAAGLLAADRVVAPSAYQSRLLCRHYGRGADRVIANGIPPVAPPLGHEDGGCLVVTAGRAWDAAKGVAVLDAALRRLGAEAPRAVLLGPLEGPCGQALAVESLEARGPLSRAAVDGWLARATLYVAPSLYEPFGLAPLEAAARGCALLLTDLGSFRELWDGAATFVPPGDEAALADALRRLAREPAEVRRLGRAARARALERFAASRMTAAYLDLYRELAAGRAPGVRRGRAVRRARASAGRP
ncbi:MAG: glycosyltransferase family 4 protein [Gemmatimonadota bacterium]